VDRLKDKLELLIIFFFKITQLVIEIFVCGQNFT